MDIKLEDLRAILPLSGARATIFLGPLNEAMSRFGIDSPTEQASFLAQIAVESGQLSRTAENLNYSAQGLANTWARFSTTGVRGGPPTAQALSIARDPVRIANLVYANRLGNGAPETGDGWNYRGSGLMQITFKNNFALIGGILRMDLVRNPAIVRTDPEVAALTAGAFWHANKLDLYDNDDSAVDETRIVTGGATALPERQAFMDKALEVLA